MREYHFDDQMIKKATLTLTGHGTVIKIQAFRQAYPEFNNP